MTGTNPARAAGLTVTINGHGSVSPTYKGKALTIGDDYPIKAIPAAGFAFSDWIETSSTNTTTNTNAKLTFQMESDLQLTANFVDVKPPTLAIKTKNATGTNSVVAVMGTASDNAGVTSVWWQTGSSGWNRASSSDGYTNWLAIVLLGANDNNFQAYAEDAAGNRSPTNTVTLTDDSTGVVAPESVAGTTLRVMAGNSESVVMSFDGSTFSFWGSGGASTGVGIYTYSLSDPQTGLLSLTFTAPPSMVSEDGSASIIGLAFTSGTNGTFTNNHGYSGSFTFSDASSTAPGSISGRTVQGMDAGSNVYQFTNSFGNGTFTATATDGDSSGTYTYARFAPDVGLVQESLTDGSTNYVLLDFSPGSNAYYVESYSTNGTFTNTGSFSALGEEATTGYKSPGSLAGLTGAVTFLKNGKRTSFTISFGESTYGQFTANTTKDNDGVGAYTYTRTGTNTAVLQLSTLFPPDASTNNGTSTVPLVFANSHSGSFNFQDGSGNITLSESPATVPFSLVGKVLKGGSGGYAFGYGVFAGVGKNSGDGGTYTYSFCGPKTASATLNFTSGNDGGGTNYAEFWFSSASGGSYVSDNGQGKLNSGSFTVK